MTERDIQRLTLLALHERDMFFWNNDTGVAIAKVNLVKLVPGQRIGARDGTTHHTTDGDVFIPAGMVRPLAYGLRGSPDLLGVVGGRFIGIEMKTDVGVQSDQQKRFQKRFEREGGIYIVARSPEDAIQQLEQRLGHRIS